MMRPTSQRVTVALSQHRPETVRPAAALMARHDTVILEEPPSRKLERLLVGDLPVDAYVRQIDTEYPEFSRRMARALIKLHANGKRIVAVEPFLGHLVAIHEGFAAGGAPTDLQPETDRWEVYLAERDATAALLGFYETAVTGSFDQVVSAVKRFARRDAARFVLRDTLRARALAPLLATCGSAYIEAGQMHYALWRYLRRAAGGAGDVRLRFLIEGPGKHPDRRQHLYGPGDILTLLYIFHPDLRDPREDLLAGRSLIYNKLITKQEIPASGTQSPHADNEAAVINRVHRLSLADCRTLFPLIRREKTVFALDIVDRHLDAGSSLPGT